MKEKKDEKEKSNVVTAMKDEETDKKRDARHRKEDKEALSKKAFLSLLTTLPLLLLY